MRKHISQLIDEHIGKVPDFPKPGILFYDINPLLNSDVFTRIVDDLHLHTPVFTKDMAIVAIESRGFLFGAALAHLNNAKLILARKPGKLPPPVLSVNYELEYGTDSLEIQTRALDGIKEVVIVDDLFATGGTARAVVNLLQEQGIRVIKCLGIIGLDKLGYADKLGDVPVYIQKTYKE